MSAPKCTHCGSDALEQGFMETGQGSHGYGRWVPGALQRGVFGGAKLLGKERWLIDALRCTVCSHLELFARPKP